MATKKINGNKNRRQTDAVPDATPHLPLDGKSWQGYDGAAWIDLAVDSRSQNVILWLRKRVENAQYFLIAACIGGHVMKKELSIEEAQYVYNQLPSKASYVVSFPESEAELKERQALNKKLTGTTEK